ncbi:MAG: porin family protein [Flavobacteriaceae bacterium]|nr:porin family protein [Flavobacteriaceae bacterium]
MKKCLLLAAFCLTSMGIFAQAPLEKGALQLNTGFGTSGWGTPIFLGLDYGVGNNFTVGAEVSYQSKSQSVLSNSYKSTAIGVGVNGNYHFNEILNIPSKWDFYGGLNVNYYNWSYDNDLYKVSDATDLGIGAQLGGRYFFTETFGLNLEIGGGNATSGGKIGITFKF